jgi:hypothetical protein
MGRDSTHNADYVARASSGAARPGLKSALDLAGSDDLPGACKPRGALVLLSQLRELRYVVVATQSDPSANFEAVGRLAQSSGWHVTGQEPGRRLLARTPGSVLSQGEIVAQFRQHDVLVASICDPGSRFFAGRAQPLYTQPRARAARRQRGEIARFARQLRLRNAA